MLLLELGCGKDEWDVDLDDMPFPISADNLPSILLSHRRIEFTGSSVVELLEYLCAERSRSSPP